MGVTAEGAVVLGRAKDVMLRAHQNQRHRQAKAGHGFRHGDDIGFHTHFLEGEEGAGPTATCLNVIDDQQRAVIVSDGFKLFHKLGGGRVEATLALNGFQHDRRRGIDTAGGVGEHLFKQCRTVDTISIGFKWHARHARLVHASAATVIAVTGRCQRPHGHTMKTVGERDYIGAAGDLAGDLHRRLNGVGASRAGEHHLMIHAARREDQVVETVQEGFFGLGVKVETMGDAVLQDVLDQRILHIGVIVAVVQRGTARQKVDVTGAVFGEQLGPACGVEGRGERTAVGARIAFAALIDRRVCFHVFGHGGILLG